MKFNEYGLDGEPLSCCSLESDPVTGLSTPSGRSSEADQVYTSKVRVSLFSVLFIGVTAFLVSQSNIFN